MIRREQANSRLYFGESLIGESMVLFCPFFHQFNEIMCGEKMCLCLPFFLLLLFCMRKFDYFFFEIIILNIDVHLLVISLLHR